MISGTRTLFNWSLRSDIKSTYPHVVRAGFCGFMLLAVLAAWSESLGGSAPGLAFFAWICRLNILLISVSGISYFVSAVTEEKDSGTLALLRLAGVSPLAIVLSNSTSRLISSLMLLMIQMPFTFLAITLGGIAWQQIIACYLALAAWMCLVANVALFCSVRSRTSGRAATLATTLLLGFFAAGPILLAFSGLSWTSTKFTATCKELYKEQQLLSVVSRLDTVLDTNGTLTLFAEQFRRNMLVGCAMFGLSVLLFNRYSHPQESNPHGRSAKVRRFTVGRCWKFPLVWKDFLFFTGGGSLVTLKLLGYAALVGGFVWFHQLDQPGDPRWLSRDLCQKAFATVSILLTVEMLLYSSNSLFMEARQSTISTLRMLPIHTPVILLQKVGACCLALMPALVALIVLVCYDYQGLIGTREFSQTIVMWLFFIFMSTHLTVLLSLYTKWAALPIAVLVSFVSFPCIGGAAAGLSGITAKAAALNGIHWGVWLGIIVNFVWMWLFVLLPIEIEIVNRWNRLSRE